MENRQKSRTMRKAKTRLPGGKNVVHYSRRKPSKSQCAGCGDVLKGVSRNNPSKTQNTPKSKKRPERPFGGILCSRCMRREFINRFRISLSK